MILPDIPQDARAVADHYDELDPFYREVWGEHVHHGLWTSGRETRAQAVEALSLAVADRLALRAGARLIDIGCGYGATARLFAGRFGAAVTGFTVAKAQADHAGTAAGAAGHVTILHRDWLANGLPDAAFDGAYAIESSEHMVDKQRFFAEAWRTLRPGGRLVVCAWLAAERSSGWAVRHLLEPICREGRLPSMGSESEYRAMAEAAGFTVAGFADVSRQVRRTWDIIVADVARRVATSARYRAFLRDARAGNRIFVATLPRLAIAYRTGAMRYGIFTLVRPDIPGAS
ncbi:class I SAM-dependent methyltransferase [Sphingomonas profundi]|uniref:class I SAM-dependent methyltransferase n=1 Tax=Alterirhizorhabdus profundi TaxID=2681549 RepID=UPI0012E94ED8|nr:class I SAM-dependent methyltransferase [Sphingomonas profundi]